MNYTKLSFAPEDYNPIVLKGKYTDRELRREYTRLRDIAVKRLKRIGQSEFSTSKTYIENVGRITPKLSTIGSASELARRLTDLARFVSSETSSVSGLRSKRKRAINALHDAGYDFVDASNLDDFIDFMDFNRSLKRGGLYDSDRVAELFAGRKKRKSVLPTC